MSEKYIPVKPPSKAEVLYEYINNAVFPVGVLKFVKKDKIDSHQIKVEVSEELYEKIDEYYQTDEITLFVAFTKEEVLRFGTFSADMQNSHNFLSELELISSSEKWASEADDSIRKHIKNKRIEINHEKPPDSIQTDQLLNIFKIKLDDFNKENISIIDSLTKDVISSKQRDKTTIIYRLAMTFFHSASFWDTHIFKILDEPFTLYLQIINDAELYKTYPNIINFIKSADEKFEIAKRVKVLYCYILAAFFYYRNLVI